MSTILLKNESMTVEISSLGAEMLRITDSEGYERLWSGDPAFWAYHAPVLFPVAGGFRNDAYTLNGQTYPMTKHGLCRKREFAVQEATDTKAIFLLAGQSGYHDGFPFAYEFRVIYTLNGKSLTVSYDVTNLSSETLYCSAGAHEAYAADSGIEDYEILFDKDEGGKVASNILVGNLISHETIDLPLNDHNALELKTEFFAVDAQVFTSLVSRGVTLQTSKNNRKIHVGFEGNDYMLLWTKPGAPYICIEPWANHPDFVDADMDITKKDGFMAVPAHSSDARAHVITLL